MAKKPLGAYPGGNKVCKDDEASEAYKAQKPVIKSQGAKKVPGKKVKK